MARKEWLVNGDRNSHFFHQSMKTRKTRSRIVKLKDSSGVWVEKPDQIKQLFINDFTTRFKSAPVSPSNIDMKILNVVSTVDNDTLLQSILDSEIKEAVFQMDKFKAPGPDGFGAAFYQNY